MSTVRINLEMNVSFDTDDYAMPSDGKVGMSIKDDIAEAINVNTAMEVHSVKILKISKIKE